MFEYEILAKSLVSYIFRNGIVEEYHSCGCLSDKQMKSINVEMVNKLSFYFKLLDEERYDDIGILLYRHSIMTRSWYKPCFDECEIELAKIKEFYS